MCCTATGPLSRGLHELAVSVKADFDEFRRGPRDSEVDGSSESAAEGNGEEQEPRKGAEPQEQAERTQ